MSEYLIKIHHELQEVNKHLKNLSLHLNKTQVVPPTNHNWGTHVCCPCRDANSLPFVGDCFCPCHPQITNMSNS